MNIILLLGIKMKNTNWVQQVINQPLRDVVLFPYKYIAWEIIPIAGIKSFVLFLMSSLPILVSNQNRITQVNNMVI